MQLKASLELLINFGSKYKYSIWRDIHRILPLHNNFEISFIRPIVITIYIWYYLESTFFWFFRANWCNLQQQTSKWQNVAYFYFGQHFYIWSLMCQKCYAKKGEEIWMLVTEHQHNGTKLTACVNVLQQVSKINGEILMEIAEGSFWKCTFTI